jgi:hypothetical protein
MKVTSISETSGTFYQTTEKKVTFEDLVSSLETMPMMKTVYEVIFFLDELLQEPG